MIKNMQVRKLQNYLWHGMSLSQSALKSGMSETTARKYRHAKILSRNPFHKRTWRTRKDPFENVWGDVYEWLKVAPQLPQRVCRIRTSNVAHTIQIIFGGAGRYV